MWEGHLFSLHMDMLNSILFHNIVLRDIDHIHNVQKILLIQCTDDITLIGFDEQGSKNINYLNKTLMFQNEGDKLIRTGGVGVCHINECFDIQ